MNNRSGYGASVPLRRVNVSGGSEAAVVFNTALQVLASPLFLMTGIHKKIYCYKSLVKTFRQHYKNNKNITITKGVKYYVAKTLSKTPKIRHISRKLIGARITFADNPKVYYDIEPDDKCLCITAYIREQGIRDRKRAFEWKVDSLEQAFKLLGQKAERFKQRLAVEEL